MKQNPAIGDLSVEIPNALVAAVQAGRAVLFLGAGASLESKDGNGLKPPNGEGLAELIGTEFFGEPQAGVDLMQVAAMAGRSAGKNVVHEFIREVFRAFRPSKAHTALADFRWHTIATTNYDTLIEDGYGENANPAQDLVKFVKDSEPIERRIAAVERPLKLMKLHGCIEHVHDGDIPLVLDAASYEQYQENRSRLFDRLSDIAHELPFVFIGYQISDPHIRNILYRLSKNQTRPEYYLVTPNPASALVEHWAAEGVTILDATFGQFMNALDQKVPQMWRAVKSGSFKPDLPLRKHFRTNDDPSERLVQCLETDLAHVHALMPTESLDAKDFFRGLEQGFSAIASNFDVERRLTNDLLLDLVDDKDTAGIVFRLVRGAGGTGKTILLKRLAWEVAKEFDEPVFWLNENGVLKVDAIRELHALTGKRLYVFVDSAATHVEKIKELLQIAKDRGFPITIIGAERDTVWNSHGSDIDREFKTKDMTLGQLAPNEIQNLVLKLRDHNALGIIASIPKNEQIKAFEYADRHLLVALHEVTQGKRFEEIVVSEYEGISPAKARQMYLDICTLHQFAAPVRAGVVNRISAIPFSVYKEKFFAPLQGVILTQQNRYSGDFEYKARHPRVASLVFRGAFDDDDSRVDQIVRVVTSLDIGYSSDDEAIRRLISGRNLKMLVSDVNAGRRMYDAVAEYLGFPWFVWHQRAVFEMNHEDGSYDQAETNIRKALEIEPKKDAVIHTFAEISRRKALQASSPIRRQVFRRQAAERLSDLSNSRSAYADYTRCKIRLDELSEIAKLSKVDENEDTISELEEANRSTRIAIDNALSRHPEDAEIFALDAEWHRLMNDVPAAKRALQKAWAKGTKGPRLALQLAKLYRKSGNSDQELSLLQEALDRDNDDTSINLAMGRFLIRDKDTYNQAGFFLARSYRLTDRNYEARYLHAQHLFSNGEGEKAADLFDQVDNLAPSQFKPKWECDETLISRHIGTINGRIVRMEETYAFVRSNLYPRDMHASYYNSDDTDWQAIRNQSTTDFDVAFNRMGPIVIRIRRLAH